MLTLDRVQIVNGDFQLSADLVVQSGAHVSVLGPSGAGKSTLLAAIAGFIKLGDGHIRWNDDELTSKPVAARPLSILFQDNNLFPHLTAAQNVALGVRPSLRLSSAEHDHVNRALASVGLEGLADRKPAALSGGQQSRVALARVLLRAQPLLLLDEPFAALGPGLRAEMLDLVRRIASDAKQTLLMVTHDMQDAKRLDGETIFVDAGRAHAPIATPTLFANPPDALRNYISN